MKHPNNNLLLRIAQGDAYCHGTEYIKIPRDQEVLDAAYKFEKYIKHPTHKLRAGQYTDDTQMSIAVSEVLLGQEPFGTEQFAESFFNCFKRDERDGYSRGFQALLEEVKSHSELLAKLRPDSDKNGAMMRAAPLGVIRHPLEVMRVAETQAKITHNTRDGIFTAQATALMSHYALHESTGFDKLGEFLVYFMHDFYEYTQTPFSGPVTGPRVGIKTLHAVYHLLTNEKDLMGILRGTIDFGGDTDSVAAVAFGIASTRMTEDLPEFMETGLEVGGKYGAEFLKDLGTRLMQKYE